MSKPEDIPDDIWDTTRAAWNGWRDDGSAMGLGSIMPYIARAVLAERGRCLSLVRAYPAIEAIPAIEQGDAALPNPPHLDRGTADT